MITLYENLRTIVYAPFYLADARGYWADQGLAVKIQLSPDPVETAEGLLAGRADISWGGPMRVMLHHERDPDCPLIAFGQIVARDPFVLIGRRPNPDFRFQDLLGARLAVAHEVPTPWMTFQDDLGRAGIDVGDLTLSAPAPMATAVARLAAGDIDVAQVLEPYASTAVAEGVAHVWHRFASRGDIGYTSFYTTRGYLAANPDICAALLAGITPALHAVNTAPPSALAAELAHLFPTVAPAILSAAIAGYQTAGLWARDTTLPPAAFVRLKAALLSGGLISRDLPYDHVIAQMEAK
jgi:NitT/TauT family transport system substrate-binding protein